MAPRETNLPYSMAFPMSRTIARNTDTDSPSPKTLEANSLPENETTAAMAPLTPSATLESEFDLESESDLPTMTPPPKQSIRLRHRNTSPFNSISGSSPSNIHNTVSVPPMQRAHSSPGVDSAGRIITPTHSYPRRPSSPLSSGRRRSPLRSAFEESYPGASWSSLSMEPNIPEHEELEISTPLTPFIPENEFGNISSIPTYTSISNTLPRSRRRPTSPLHQSASAPSLHASSRATSLTSTAGTPPSFSALSAAKYANEPYPTYGYSFSSASSMPSTPTSLRSRSPSISSLETIEDTPDAEEAARLEEEDGKQRTGEEIDGGVESKRKGADLRATNLRSNKDRKRWSVCGAERRADFSLEPIEE